MDMNPSRREVLKLSAALGVAAPTSAPRRTRIVLADDWLVKQLSEPADPQALTREAQSENGKWLRARMPAQIHEILLAHGLIPDPHVSKNAAASAWVGQKDWAYACRFPTPSSGIDGPVFLNFEGLDTLATAYLNGARLGQFDNMFREYRVDVRRQLAPAGAGNVLLVIFSAPLAFIDRVRQPSEHVRLIEKFKYLRKAHSDFSSYLGASPHSVKVGIYRDVALDIPHRSWIEDVWVRTELSRDFGRARLRTRIETAGEPAALEWKLFDPSGREQDRGTLPPGTAAFDIDVTSPRLWWPRTHGQPNLYRLSVSLTAAGAALDTRDVTVGIRDIRPVFSDPVTGEKRFRFEINGRPIYLKGACWAPLEGMTHCWIPDRASRLLDLAVHGRMNIVRVWGEGHVPPQQFYDECDRRGILVWQDFMFGYGMHPVGLPEFDENCRAEIEGLIRRLRNHPSLLLWVGGNENHMGIDFAGIKTAVGHGLFDKIMPDAVARLDPDRHFHPSSPYGGPVPNWPLEGDWHDYTTLTFSPDASVPLFASEVGRVSAPSLTSMKRFLSPEELWPGGYDAAVRTPGKPAWPPMWQYRSVGGSWDKVGPVEQYPDPASAADLIRVLGTAHGEYLRERVERHRRGVPGGAPPGNRRNWGNMVWRLNDPWPILYWSVIDSYLEPKIAYYFLRRAYSPVLLSFERTADRIHVWVINDSPDAASGNLVVKRVHFDGTVRGEMRADVAVAPGGAKRCLDLTEFGPISLRQEFLQASFAGQDATFLLTGERYLHLPQSRLSVTPAERGVLVSTDRFARQVTLEMAGTTGAVFEDNFFDLAPGQARAVAIVNADGGRDLRVSALNAPPVLIRADSTR